MVDFGAIKRDTPENLDMVDGRYSHSQTALSRPDMSSSKSHGLS